MKGGIAAVLIAVCVFGAVRAADDTYSVGFGIHDETGPASGAVMMGYAMPEQGSLGIHLRQFARAVVVVDAKGNRVVYVNNDMGMTMQAVYLEVVKQLKEKYGGLYGFDNVLISSTHTHSGPGGFSHYMLYNISTKGFCQATFDAYVGGIVGAISRAHDNIKAGVKIFSIQDELTDASGSRSPTTYLLNPAEERAKYKHDTDKEMTVLKFVGADNKPIGMLSWFAVHGVSMKNENHYISSDNKGYAAVLMEQAMNKGALPGKGEFVAIFGQANEGDSTPNYVGEFCGKPYVQPRGPACDAATSTCGGKTEMCHSWGPGKDEFESTKIVGTQQYKKAMDMFAKAATPVTGPVAGVQTFVTLPGLTVAPEFTSTGKEGKVCKAAMGYSFAAGTIDGPGMFDFTQGDTHGDMMWKLLSSVLRKPTQENTECQHPKPILLDVGEMSDIAGVWAPSMVPLQVVRLGNFIIPAVPSEFTTMSGRRLRAAVKAAVTAAGLTDPSTTVVMAGLANTYAGYTATYEEYQGQRYEGASTMYGPHQLAAYTQEFTRLATMLVKGEKPAPVPVPEDLSKKTVSFITPVLMDTCPSGKNYGDVLVQPNASYKIGEFASVSFVGGDPRNNLKHGDTYLTVERKDGSAWAVVHTDGSWETRILSTKNNWQEVTTKIDWEIPANAQAGTYRIRHFGTGKSVLHGLTDFEGVSNEFTVSA